MNELLNKLRAYNNSFSSMQEFSRKSIKGEEVIEFISLFSEQNIKSLEQISLSMKNKLNDVNKLLILLHIIRERGYKRSKDAYAYKELEEITLDLGLRTPSFNLTELIVTISQAIERETRINKIIKIINELNQPSRDFIDFLMIEGYSVMNNLDKLIEKYAETQLSVTQALDYSKLLELQQLYKLHHTLD